MYVKKFLLILCWLTSSCLLAEIIEFGGSAVAETIGGETCWARHIWWRDTDRDLQYESDGEKVTRQRDGEIVATRPATYVKVHPGTVRDYGDLEFPSSFLGIPVTKVGSFYRNEKLTSVYIPDSVIEVGAGAFSECPSLRSVRFPAYLKTLPNNVCDLCPQLESVSLTVETEDVGARAFYGCSAINSVAMPGVKSVGIDAFTGCASIRSVTIQPIFKMNEVFPNAYREITEVTLPDGVEKICDFSFTDCRHLRSINIPESVTEIGESAFENCRRLESITLPAGVKRIGDYAFYGCGALKEIKYLGEKPEIGLAAFVGTSIQGGEGATLEIKNATVHYVLRSNNPDIAVPLSDDTGFVNVITEVKGGAVSVPSTWASNYPTFTQKFGDDFLKALMKPTGKIASDGSAMLVWQDYVAGTDPTKQSDTFTASITMVDGKVKVSYSPEFEDDRKDLRKYTTLGKRQLQDVDWVEVPPGEEGNYNFFKVTVEMK